MRQFLTAWLLIPISVTVGLSQDSQDPGWPRLLTKEGNTLIYYQPQVDHFHYANDLLSTCRSKRKSRPPGKIQEIRYTAGYMGAFVLGVTVGAIVASGSGYYYPPYIYRPPYGYPMYYPYPTTYGVYGASAHYNPANRCLRCFANCCRDLRLRYQTSLV